MTNQKHIDYLQCSCSIDEKEFRDYDYKLVPPLKFYRRGYIDGHGTRYFFGNYNSSKCLVVCAGEALQSLRNDSKSDNEIVKSLIELDGKVTRIDHAITQIDDGEMITIAEMQEFYLQKKIQSPLVKRGAQAINHLELDGKIYPETFYIGDIKKRAEKGLFRAYDRGNKIAALREIMIRLELEERGENAHNSARRIAEGASVASVFKSRFTIEDEKFERIIDAESVDISRSTAAKKIETLSEEEKRWKWLIEQVAPTLKKAIELGEYNHDKASNIAEFITKSGLTSEMMKASEFIANQKLLRYYSLDSKNEIED